jgi:hypothetical protein
MFMQRVVFVSEAHSFPPYDAGTVAVLVEVFVPPPQVAVQAESTHWNGTTQSTAHGAVLQPSVSVVTGQPSPTLLACRRIVRVCVLVPPPQDFVHCDHWLQAVCSQWIGHVFVLQF